MAMNFVWLVSWIAMRVQRGRRGDSRSARQVARQATRHVARQATSQVVRQVARHVARQVARQATQQAALLLDIIRVRGHWSKGCVIVLR